MQPWTGGTIRVLLLVVFIASVLFVGARITHGSYRLYMVARYPLNHIEEISACQEEFGLEPAYVAAVIYEESRFNPEAHSKQNAIGLMQIVPETGMHIAGKLKDPDFTIDKLRDESTNIRYGCYYLSYLSSRYGDPQKALAAYNAGPGNVDLWSLEGPFQIKFEETTNFVARVERSQAVYKELYFSQNK